MKARMRKGFFRILEVVIVAMLVFVTLTQLYSVPKANQPSSRFVPWLRTYFRGTACHPSPLSTLYPQPAWLL